MKKKPRMRAKFGKHLKNKTQTVNEPAHKQGT